MKSLKYRLIREFGDIILNKKVPSFCEISMTIGRFAINSVPVSYYRNIKIKPSGIASFFRFKSTKSPNSLLFDIIELYDKSEVLTSVIFRLFTHIKIIDIENPAKFRII